MRDCLLFFDVHNPDYLPLIRAVVEEGFTPIMTGGVLAEECRREGMYLISWESYTPKDFPALAKGEMERLATELGQAFLAPEVRQAFVGRRGDLLRYICNSFINQLVQILHMEIGVIETWQALWRRHRPRLIVLGCDNSPSQRTLVLAAKETGIPTLQLAHGMLGPSWGRVAGEMHTLYARYLAAYGRRSRNFLVSQGNQAERIFLTGAPLWDQFYRAESRIDRLEARRRMGLEPHRPVVMLTTSYVDGSSAFFSAIARRYQAIHEAVLRAVGCMGGGVQLLVRPHPNEVGRLSLPPQQIALLDQAYLDYLAEHHGLQVRLCRSHKMEAIRAADVIVVSGQSSVIPEAMILERPVVSLPLFPEEARTFGREDGVIIAAEDEKLPEVLDKLLSDAGLREEVRRQQQEALPDINEGHDGCASERVRSLIVELAGQPSKCRGRGQRGAEMRSRTFDLKLLYAVHNFLPHSYAGTEIYTRDLALAMQARGHQVRVLYPRPVQKRPGEPEFVIKEGDFEGLAVAQLVAPLHIYSAIRNEALKPVLRQYLQKHRPDLVHVQHLMGLTISFLEVLKEMQIPVVMTANDYWLLCNQIHLVKAGGMVCEGPETIDQCVHCMMKYLTEITEDQIPQFFYYLADRYYTNHRAVKLLDRLFFPARFQMELFQRYQFVNQKMVHLPQGANLFKALERGGHRPPPVRFSYLGTICYRKGLDILVEAFNQINTREAELHVYGNVVEQGYFDKVKANNRAGERVIFHGGYSPADLPRILVGTDVAVVPSRGENFPFVIREILHGGVPVIAAAVAGIPEIITDNCNGLLFRANDPADLAAKLEMVIAQPEIIEDWRAGIKPVKSIVEDAQEIEEYYRQVLEERTPAFRPQESLDGRSSQSFETLGKLEPIGQIGKGEEGVTTSIIIPVFNHLDLNRQCLESIYNNTELTGVEIIVVDNGSTDGSSDYLRREEKERRVRLVANTSHLGFAKACNQGARAARGDYLIFLNNDTIVTSGWLQGLSKVLEKDERIGIVGAKLLYPDKTIQHAGVAFDDHKRVGHIYRGFHESHPAVNKGREFQVVTAACMMIRKSVFFAAGGFDEHYQNGFEDVDLCFQVRSLGHKVFYTPECVVYHLESKTPGRHAKERENSLYFQSRWQEQVQSDWLTYHEEDGISLELIEYDEQGEPLYIMRDHQVTLLWQQAVTLRKQGLFPQAVDSYRQALRINPYDNRRYLITAELAETYRAMGKYFEAAQMYQFLVGCTPEPRYPYELGRLQKKLGKLKEAVENLEKAKAILKATEASGQDGRHLSSLPERGGRAQGFSGGEGIIGGMTIGCLVSQETSAV